jgi:hypothetical protein
MSDSGQDDIELQLKLLRDQVARLITENLELRRQLVDLQRARTDASIESLANSTVRSLRLAENQINIEAQDDKRYAISELETSFRGMLLPRNDSLDFRAPIPEYDTLSGHLSTIHMTFVNVPVLPSPPSAGQSFLPLLERIQAEFLNWERGEGNREANEIVAQTTYLLSMSLTWTSAEFRKGMLKLAETLVRFGKTIQQALPPIVVVSYQQAAANLLQLVQSLVEKGSLEPEELKKLSAALEQIILIQN